MVANRNALKTYAPQARKDFIRAMTDRAALFGVTKEGFTPGEERGDLFLIGGKAFPKVVAAQRRKLLARIEVTSFDDVMEAVAYTWFNRFLAIRYIELHGYFDHGYRVLSHPRGEREPEILQQAQHLSLPGLDQKVVVELKLAGDKDEVLYRRILIGQCNDLHKAMPFLFERIDDETELLLPENLLQTDSIIRKLVNSIAEPEWDEVEIIGWLYQFYISEKKDQVMGKVVKSGDIPAATQLFTPNWIVKYMVQNSLGAQWLATYPDSGIRAGMEYYIAPAEQTPEVKAQIDAITPKQLDLEAITLIDPAVGSGHILVEAYDLFRSIYLERGYTKREAARAILTKNLFGLDIDDRAAQMAGFALLMKACADDRSVLRNPPTLNVLALQEAEALDADALASALLPHERFELVPSGDLLPETLRQPTLAAKQPTSAEASAIKALVTLFEGAKTFGSLITVPDKVMQSLPLLDALLAKPLTGDLLLRRAQEDAQELLKPLVEQARLLGDSYDCVVGNPPYLGGRGVTGVPKLYENFAVRYYPEAKIDTYAMFIRRGSNLRKRNGISSFVVKEELLYLPSLSSLRFEILNNESINSVWKIGSGAFSVRACAIVLSGSNFGGKSIILAGSDSENGNKYIDRFDRFQREFLELPNNIIEPSAPISAGLILKLPNKMRSVATAKQGMSTTDNPRFLRYWWEIARDAISQISTSDPKKSWFLYNKGGAPRKWYGNVIHVVNYKDNGSQLLDLVRNKYRNISDPEFVIRNRSLYFREGVTWSRVRSSGKRIGFRYNPEGLIFDTSAMLVPFSSLNNLKANLAFLNSSVVSDAIQLMSPGTDFNSEFDDLPLCPDDLIDKMSFWANDAINAAKDDWDGIELSIEYRGINIFQSESKTIDEYINFSNLQYENNILSIRRLQKQIDKSVVDYISRYFHQSVDSNGYRVENFERETTTEFDIISYAFGCMMGRYSLAEPGLIYAHSGGIGFDPSRYGPFPADDDGIIPLTEEQWFGDDAAVRIEEFLCAAWPKAPVTETMFTLMNGLSKDKAGEPRAALRSYLSKQFYKDHLQTYKNRPIYWLFSSGKQKAFEALVYLHRYNEGTLARMRTVYVTPLMGKLQQRVDDLDAEIAVSASSAEKTRKTREKDKLLKQVSELRVFDEELRHLADQRIELDLDDGVKVNYGRFGNLLAAKDKVCGKDDKED
ncbi:MAG: hypothetical protein CFE28_16210 [Alphaproteobacteria bacterium PA2]|nr:MAG: hypothetical protein CFE28_16210 [Alphaproteobacteria bacterium PA2]